MRIIPLSIAFAAVIFPAALFPAAPQPEMTQADAPEPRPAQAPASIEVVPAALKLSGSHDYTQVLVTARFADGTTVDVTRFAKFSVDGAEVSPAGVVTPKADGNGKLRVEFSGKTAEAPITVERVKEVGTADFIRDVNPVMTKLGCNGGTCHGAKDGKFGFKLSLRGYDPLYDVRSLKDDLAGRRLNVASPDDSLMLLKSTAGVPHEGGQRTKVGEKYYAILRAWIADGAKLDTNAPRVTGIEVLPKNPVVQQPGSRQQFRIVAKYSDGLVRDVTQEAFIESGNGDVAAVVQDANGLVKTLRRGEAPVLARFEGSYAATTITVMGDRTGFTWQPPETWGRIDELVAAKWQRMKILPSGLCSDSDFIRRVYLDLTGLPPTVEQLRAFLADTAPLREKRDALIERLIGSPEFVEHWTNKWCDMLQVNSKFLGGGVGALREWIKKQVAANTPYDQFVHEILTASGSNKANPAAGYWKILNEPAAAMENTTHLFLGTRFNCNKCHDHPFERWTQDQYYKLGAYFAQVALKADPQGGGGKVGGTDVEKARPLYEIVDDQPEGEMIHQRTNKVAEPGFPYPAAFKPEGTRRQQLASWITSADNRYFAPSYVNRLWGYLLGAGIIEPLDDIRAGNPPGNPELLDFLAQEFVRSKFDVRQIFRIICKSRTYQLDVGTNRWNEDDKSNYSHALARRLPAEVLYDSILHVTGAPSRLPGGVRAAMLSDALSDLPSGFLANAGRPPRESSCECERSSELRLGSVMALLSGPAVSDAIGDPNSAIPKLVAAQPDDAKLVDELFMRVINRPAKDSEIQKTIAAWTALDKDHAGMIAALDAKEKEQLAANSKAEAARLAAIDAAKKELARYEAEIESKLTDDERNKKAERAAAAAAIADYEKTKYAAALARFIETTTPQANPTGWHPLNAADFRATGDNILERQPDGSFRVTGNRANATDYVVKFDTKLAGITGIMLEVLPTTGESNLGPGRAPDGNFVLTEIALKTGAHGTGANPVDVRFTKAIADYSQPEFPAAAAIDGARADGNNGWGIAGALGQPHQLALTLEKPIGNAAQGVRLRVELHQPRAGGFSIGRFRLWATTSPGPVQPGFPVAVVEALRKPATARTAADRAALDSYWKENDPELRRHRLALLQKQGPAPVDPGIAQRRATIAAAEAPLKLDPGLLQLRADVEQSKAQLTNRRLTAAQDLVWALVNNPAFLFNR